MPLRKILIVSGEIYHIFNRSVGRLPVFNGNRECQRFLDLMDYYRYFHPQNRFSHYIRLTREAKTIFMEQLHIRHPLLVDLLAFAIMPNHFHMLLRQRCDKWISEFLRNLQNSYARYYNTKDKRFGALFQSMYKCVRIETDEQLWHVTRYIHLNPIKGYIVKDIESLSIYPWTSYPIYVSGGASVLVEKSTVLNSFSAINSFQEFTANQADYETNSNLYSYLCHDPEVSS